MSEYVTRSELDAAIDAVRADIADTEQRLRQEWTDTIRFEFGRVTSHLTEQDTKINWTLGLQISLLLAAISGLLTLLYIYAK